MLTNFLDDQRDESVIDVDATTLGHHLDNVFVVEVDDAERALLLEGVISGQLDLVALHQFNLSAGSLQNERLLT